MNRLYTRSFGFISFVNNTITNFYNTTTNFYKNIYLRIRAWSNPVNIVPAITTPDVQEQPFPVPVIPAFAPAINDSELVPAPVYGPMLADPTRYSAKITDANEAEIYALLEQSQVIVTIDLQNNKSPDHNYVRPDPLIDMNTGFARVLLNNNRIRQVSLNGVGIDTAGLQTLADILAGDHNRLEFLNLSNNNREGTKWHDRGLQALFAALGRNRSLKSIQLHRTNIVNDMAASIAGCLEENNTIEYLDLTYNELYARGIRFILKAIQRNPNSAVIFMSLKDNDIYDYNVGDDPNPDFDSHHVRVIGRFPMGDQATVYKFIREISEIRDAINEQRAAIIPAFLSFASANELLRLRGHKPALNDDITRRVGEMLFSDNVAIRRAKAGDSEKCFIKPVAPLALDCPAYDGWTGPRIS